MNLRDWVGVSARAWCLRAALSCWLLSWWLATCFGVEVASGHFTDGLTLIEAALCIFVGLALRCVPGITSVATATTLQVALLLARLHQRDAVGCSIIALVLLSAAAALWRQLRAPRGEKLLPARSGPCPVFERTERVRQPDSSRKGSRRPADCRAARVRPRRSSTVPGKVRAAGRSRNKACPQLEPRPSRPRCARRTRTLPPELLPSPARELPLAPTVDAKTITDPRGIEDHDTWRQPRRRQRPQQSRYRQRLEQRDHREREPLARTGTDA